MVYCCEEKNVNIAILQPHLSIPFNLSFICRDGSDEIRYNELIHTSENGTACRNQVYLKNICLLPTNQSHKEEFICRESEYGYT